MRKNCFFSKENEDVCQLGSIRSPAHSDAGMKSEDQMKGWKWSLRDVPHICHHGDPPAAPPRHCWGTFGISLLWEHSACPCRDAQQAWSGFGHHGLISMDWYIDIYWESRGCSRCFHVQGVQLRCPGVCGCSGSWVWLLDEAGWCLLWFTLYSLYFQVSVHSFSWFLTWTVPAPQVCGPSPNKALSQEIHSDVAF